MQIYLETTLNYMAGSGEIEKVQQLIQQGKIEKTKEGLSYLILNEDINENE